MINFPDAPTVGQIHTSGGTSWSWDGTKWIATWVGLLSDENVQVAETVDRDAAVLSMEAYAISRRRSRT
jgi:hypothetical protein